jgi:hypothetical protein
MNDFEHQYRLPLRETSQLISENANKWLQLALLISEDINIWHPLPFRTVIEPMAAVKLDSTSPKKRRNSKAISHQHILSLPMMP